MLVKMPQADLSDLVLLSFEPCQSLDYLCRSALFEFYFFNCDLKALVSDINLVIVIFFKSKTCP